MRRFMFPVIALAVLAAPAALDAQTGTPRGPRGPAMAGAHGQPGAGRAIGELLIAHRDELGLTATQVAQIRRIRTQLQEQNRPLVEQVRDEMQRNRPQLTDEQRAQLQQRRAGMQARRDSLQQLTPEQRAAMRATMEQRRADMQARMQQRRDAGEPGVGRTPGQQRGPMQRAPRPGMAGAAVSDELRAVLQQIRENTETARQQIHATLTEEQRAKLRELRPGTRRR